MNYITIKKSIKIITIAIAMLFTFIITDSVKLYADNFGNIISTPGTNYGGSNTMVNKAEVRILSRSAQIELENDILPFWIKNCQDKEFSGFIGRMSNKNVIEEDGPKGLVLNARILWTFSAAYRFKENDQYLEMAKKSYDYINQYFWDKEFGGAYWMLYANGVPQDTSKEVYGQAFLIYSLSEYYLATGDETALEKAKELFYTVEKNCHDDANKGYFETFSRDWKPAEKAMLASGDVREKKTMNTHLHLLEAYTNLYRIWKDPQVKTRLEELIEIHQKYIINPETSHLKLFFDEKWNSTKETVSFGHDIEANWLLCEAAEVLGNEETIKEIQATALKMAQAVYEQGLDTDGSLFYEGENGKITAANKDWWPQAEAVVGFINAYQLSKQEHFFKAAEKCWAFIQEDIVDSKNGEWFWDSYQKDNPKEIKYKVSEWKCPYHNSRACLEIIRRTKEILK